MAVMFRWLFFLTVGLMPFGRLAAQHTIRFYDDFTDTTASLWMHGDDVYSLIEIRNGRYYVNSKVTGYSINVPEVKLAKKQPFEFSVTVTCDSCPTNNGLGFGWGEAETKSSSTFVITPDGHINFYQQTPEGDEWLMSGAYSAAINVFGTNRLRVKSNGKTITVFINDIEVYTGKKGLWSEYLCLRMYDKNTAVFDDVEVIYSKPGR